jgi:hypothetical protein
MCNVVLNNDEKTWLLESIRIDYETRTDWRGFDLNKKEVKGLIEKLERAGWVD